MKKEEIEQIKKLPLDPLLNELAETLKAYKVLNSQHFKTKALNLCSLISFKSHLEIMEPGDVCDVIRIFDQFKNFKSN